MKAKRLAVWHTHLADTSSLSPRSDLIFLFGFLLVPSSIYGGCFSLFLFGFDFDAITCMRHAYFSFLPLFALLFIYYFVRVWVVRELYFESPLIMIKISSLR